MPLDLTSNPTPTSPDQIAQALRVQARNIYRNMVLAFNRGSKMFWQNPNATPQQIALALGTDGKELFELHYKLGQLLISVDQNQINEGLSVIGQFDMNPDGTVSVLDNIVEN